MLLYKRISLLHASFVKGLFLYIYTKLGSKFFILIYMTNQITRNYLRTPLVKLSLFIRIINLEIWHSAWKSDGYRV